MKRLRKLLCMAVALLWVLPVSAVEWDQHGQARLDLSGLLPKLESLEPLSDWIAITADEYLEFDSAEYELHFEIHNAVWDSTADTELFIETFDEAGNRSIFIRNIAYEVDETSTPSALTIVAGPDQGAANAFVHALPLQRPATRRVRLRPILTPLEVLDCDQPVTMRTWLYYDNKFVGSDGPIHLVIPGVFLNSC